ncbi:MAG: Rpn family recombination-promoting nuclease/putative transposase [Spirochaetales bacterium]|nr:Rpn family recombination-promoting nuclease/putative transposase [Spirochaetales bacterium]
MAKFSKKKLLEKWENAGITNDYIFYLVMKDKDLCKELIERLLGIEIEKIKKPKNQKVVDVGIKPKSVRFDVYVKNSDKVFDIEMQTTIDKSLAKRARYYQSIIDVDMIEKGSSYKELRDVYILFICTEDLFGKNLPVYTFPRICEEDNELKLDDGTHIMFFNTSAYLKEEDEKLRDILEYINTGKPQSEFTEKMQSLVDNAKSSTKWRQKYMTLEMKYRDYLEEGWAKGMEKGMERGMEKGLERGMEKGMKKGLIKGMKKGYAKGSHRAKLENASNFLKMGLSIDQVAQGTGLTVEEIQKIKL